MPKIIYISPDGIERSVEVPCGVSLMEGAVKNNVPGIDADCGGACACATCQIMIDLDWIDRVGAASTQEREMLEYAFEAEANSRLSCQIIVCHELDGLIVRTPSTQQ